MSVYSDLILSEASLQSYWRLAEAAGSFADSKGAITGTAGAGLTRAQTGLLTYDANACCYVDRSVPGSVGFGDNYDFAATANYSIEFLIKPNIVDGTPGFIYTKLDLTNGYPGYTTDFWNGGVRHSRYDAAGGVDTAYDPTGFTNATVYHYVTTYDGSNIKMYRNGSIVSGATLASTRSITNHAGIFTIGASGNGSTGMTGWLDEFAIYNTALSAASISAHYAAISSQLTLDDCLPDADVTTTGWSTAPLFSKVNDASDATVITATAV